MKKLFIFLTLVIALASCSSYSGNRKPKQTVSVSSDTTYRDVPFRAHHTWFSSVTYNRLVDHNVEIIYADSAFRAGDTILVGTKDYILSERVK